MRERVFALGASYSHADSLVVASGLRALVDSSLVDWVSIEWDFEGPSGLVVPKSILRRTKGSSLNSWTSDLTSDDLNWIIEHAPNSQSAEFYRLRSPRSLMVDTADRNTLIISGDEGEVRSIVAQGVFAGISFDPC